MQFGVGQPVPRTEDPKFLMGQGQYVDDINLHDQLYGYVLRSPHAHADIKSIDTAAAEAAPGVQLVLTGKDVAADGIGAIHCHVPPMAFGRIPQMTSPFFLEQQAGALPLMGPFLSAAFRFLERTVQATFCRRRTTR